MRYFIVCLVTMLGCIPNSYFRKTQTIHRQIVNRQLLALDSVSFVNPIVNFAIDKNNSLLILSNSLDRIYRIDAGSFAMLETIILPQRISFLKGVVSDGIYIYLYSENSLFQFDKSKDQFVTLIGLQDNIKITDLTLTEQGEIFICDDFNNKIFLINTLLKLTEFNLSKRGLIEPAGVSFDNADNRLWLYNRNQHQIEIYLRNGNLDKVLKISGSGPVKLSVSQNNLFLLSKQSGQIRQIQDKLIVNYLLPHQNLISSLIVVKDLLFVIYPNKVVKFLLQER